MFCYAPQTKLPRHLVTMHKNETEVALYMAEKDPSKKANMMCKIHNLGNHLHNVEVVRNQLGRLIVAYRPTENAASWDNYVPCQYCLGYYVYWDLWKHVRRCPLALVERKDVKKKGTRVAQAGRLLLPAPKGSSVGLNSVLVTMKVDEISICCRGDRLILQLGEKLYRRHGHDKEQYSYIRNMLRELGRLLLHLRKTVGPTSAALAEFINPQMFQSVVNSARAVAGFSEETHLYAIPSLALKFGHSLRKYAGILKGEALEKGDQSAKAEASAFIELSELKWTEEVSTHALRTLGENKRNKIKLVPLTNDVKLLTSHFKSVGEEAFKTLQSEDSIEAWSALNEAALGEIILFNRRRQGEASKMTLDDFKGKHTTRQEDVMESLSPLEQKLCQSLKRIEIIGKRGRTVPVILTNTMKRWVDLLLAKRQKAGACPKNIFVFARPYYGSLGHIRGCDCLRDASEGCGAQYPELLRSTKLRKQIGTLSQILNLKEHELDILANFMGHDIRIHRECYRLPEETIQVAKVFKLLLAMETGQLTEQRGKTPDEIEVDLEEEIDGGAGDSEDSDEDGSNEQ